MTEPIKLPNMPFDLYHGIQDCDQYNAIRKYTTDAVEQNTAELKAEVERLRDGLLAWQTASMDIMRQLKKAEAEVERLRADAERYRWLRQRYPALTTMQAARGVGLDLSRTFVNTAEKFDAAIDAARNALKEPK